MENSWVNLITDFIYLKNNSLQSKLNIHFDYKNINPLIF